jgi:16S rRNA (cytosine1402-N4)-methyltransferase
VAMAITLSRKTRPFKTTLELADFIERLLGRQGHIHPATRIFQALRIEVNHELDVLIKALTQAVEVLKPGGKIVVISYHSLEDRIVKMFFKDNSRDWINLPNEMTTTHLIPKLKTITKKPLEASEAEVKENYRSRSAKLRVAEKI